MAQTCSGKEVGREDTREKEEEADVVWCGVMWCDVVCCVETRDGRDSLLQGQLLNTFLFL